MPKSAMTVNLEMPDDFPTDLYNAIFDRVNVKRDPWPPASREWAGAWNAIPYRFKSCAEHDEQFTEIVRKLASTHADLYVRERELFGFFVAGLAAIESFCYGLYAIASMMDPANFPMTTFKDKQWATPEETTRRFEAHFSGDNLSVALRNLLNDLEFEKWKGFRNILAHRVTPLTTVHVVFGSSASTTEAWKDVELRTGIEKLEIDSNTTASRRKWLATTVSELMKQAGDWTTRYASRLPPSCR